MNGADPAGMPDFERLDRVIHERGRLALMTLLASRPAWSFRDLKVQLGMSDGNLITHLRTLERAGYIASRKEEGDRPCSTYRLTPAGRRGFRAYLGVLEEIVRANRAG